MIIHDITLPIRPTMPVWPGDPPINLQKISAIEDGEHSNVTQLQMSVHTGTHIDVPKHFFDNGITIDQIPLRKLIGEVLVMVFDDGVDVISDKVLKQHPNKHLLEKTTKVLFRTTNSSLWTSYPNEFQSNYVGIDQSAAKYLSHLPLEFIGIDYLSIAPYDDTINPHQTLLSKGIILLEGIDLSNVPGGIYELVCLPLNIIGSDGAPTRVILMSH